MTSRRRKKRKRREAEKLIGLEDEENGRVTQHVHIYCNSAQPLVMWFPAESDATGFSLWQRSTTTRLGVSAPSNPSSPPKIKR